MNLYYRARGAISPVRSLLSSDPLRYRRARSALTYDRIDQALERASWWSDDLPRADSPGLEIRGLGKAANRCVRQILVAGREEPQEVHEHYRRLRELGDYATPDARKCGPWLAARYLLIATGHHQAAVHARRTATRMALDDPKPSVRPRRAAELALSAAMDDGQFDRASAELQNLRRLGLDSWWMRNVSEFLAWCGHLSPCGASPARVGVGTEFERLIRGARVAVVGPSPPREDQGDEIESCDLVVRMSVRTSADVPPDGWSGLRTDITYWNMTKVAATTPWKQQLPDGSPSWIVLKGTLLPEGVARMRRADPPRGLNWPGDHLMVPLAVFDLLHAGAGTVKVYNTTFYAAEHAYGANYWRIDGSSGAEWKIRQLRGFARHDLLDGLHLFRALSHSRRIELDGATNAVVECDDEQFAESIDRFFPCSLRSDPCVSKRPGESA